MTEKKLLHGPHTEVRLPGNDFSNKDDFHHYVHVVVRSKNAKRPGDADWETYVKERKQLARWIEMGLQLAVIPPTGTDAIERHTKAIELADRKSVDGEPAAKGESGIDPFHGGWFQIIP